MRRQLKIKRAAIRKTVVHRFSSDEEQKLIKQDYRETGNHGLLLKTLFLTGARVSEFISLKVEDLFFDEQMVLIEKGKGGKSRYVPVLPELAQELKTHLGSRQTGYIFESNRHTKFTARRIQQIVKETAEQAGVAASVRLNPNHAARNARVRAEMFKPPAVKTRRAAFFGSRPQISACRFKQTDKTIIDDARRIAFVKNRKSHTVKPRQPVNGRQPQITVAGLNYPVNRVLRQPVVRRPMINPILRPRCGKANAKIKA